MPKMIYGYIYLITNTINNKKYVGKTTITINKRFNNHCSSKKPVISKAIRKYGRENFIVQEIAVAYSKKELKFLEELYISWFEVLVPNGYNIMKISGGFEQHSEETIEKMRKIANKPERLKISSENGKKRKQTKKNFESKFLGVHKTKNINTWSTFFKHNLKNIYIGLYKKEKDAAIAYDIFVINIIGQNAKINFEENRKKYINNIIEMPEREQNKGSKKAGKCNTKYCGVNKFRNNFRARISVKNKTIELGIYNTEKEAAYARDIADIKYFREKAILIFPELKEEYLNNKINPKRLIIGNNKKSNSRVLGVSFYSSRKKWVVQLKGLKTKRFNTLEEAEKYAINYLKIRKENNK